jgi:hypothetical protein
LASAAGQRLAGGLLPHRKALHGPPVSRAELAALGEQLQTNAANDSESPKPAIGH